MVNPAAEANSVRYTSPRYGKRCLFANENFDD